MEYNTVRNKLVIPEYGRNVQKMVEFAVSLEDKEKRNKLAKIIVTIMSQIHPLHKDYGEFKHKLWDHLHVISNFKLDIDSDYPTPTGKVFSEKPKKIYYKKKKIRFYHYGNNIELIIKKACEYEEGQEKEALIKTIANHLKKCYVNWNRESVTDEVIAKQLLAMSDGKLILAPNVRLDLTNDIIARNMKKKRVPEKNTSSSNGSSRYGDRHGDKRRKGKKF